MTDRDTFAAAALTQLLANRPPSLWTTGEAICKMEARALAGFAYDLADAMLARRDQPAPAPLSSAPQ